MKRYKIGEIAKLLGLTTQALRFYEQEGVISPKKSENGTRYFTQAEVIRLLAFKKYRMSEFSVQEVATHFQHGSLASLTDQLDAQSEKLISQSEMLLRRARSIRAFERKLREAQALEGQIVCMESPPVYLQNLTFDQLSAMTQPQRAAFDAFLTAMPESAMFFTVPTDGSREPEFRFGATPETAQMWSLPLDNTFCVAPARCVRIYVRTLGHPWEREHLYPQLDRVQAAGYALDSSRPVVGQHLASETINGAIYLYAALYVPVL